MHVCEERDGGNGVERERVRESERVREKEKEGERKREGEKVEQAKASFRITSLS